MAGPNNEFTLAGAPASAEDTDINPGAEAAGAPEAPLSADPQPEQAGGKPNPRRVNQAIAITAAALIAVVGFEVFANSEMGKRLKERWIPGYGAGEQDALRTSLIGLQFDFDDKAPSPELLAAFSEGDGSIIAGLHGRLDGAYTNPQGNPVRFDYFYGQPAQNEDGSEGWEYIRFGGGSGEGGDGDEEPSELLNIPLSGLSPNMKEWSK